LPIEDDATLSNDLTVSAIRILILHCAIIACLALAHFCSALLVLTIGKGNTLWQFTSMGGESNLPATFSAFATLVAALITLLVSRVEFDVSNRRSWVVIALVLIFMAFDEAATIHERIKRLLPGNETLGLGWIIIYGAFLLPLGIYLFRFWLRLPASTRWGLMLAAVVFLSGAVGMELVERSLLTPGLENRYEEYLRLPLVLSIMVEEVLEKLGIAILIFTLFRYAAGLPRNEIVLRIRN